VPLAAQALVQRGNAMPAIDATAARRNTSASETQYWTRANTEL